MRSASGWRITGPLRSDILTVRNNPSSANLHTYAMKNNTVRLPSIANVRAALHSSWKYLRRNFARSEFATRGGDFAGQDVRLQVLDDGRWAVHVCPSDYDQDHRGYWGASCLSYDRQNLTDLARDLISQCADAIANEV